MMTEMRYGRMFLTIIVHVLVPRHLDAMLYSRSRMIMTCVRMKYATKIHSVHVIVIMSERIPAPRM